MNWRALALFGTLLAAGCSAFDREPDVRMSQTLPDRDRLTPDEARAAQEILDRKPTFIRPWGGNLDPADVDDHYRKDDAPNRR